MDLIVAGDVMVDVSVASGVLVGGGDVHGRVRIRPGGAGANAAVWAAAGGARVRLHGRVGDDLMGRLLAEALGHRGVQAALSVDPGSPTGAMLVVHEAGERSMVADRGANASLRPDHLPSALEARAVLVSGYLLFHDGSEAAARAALERAAAAVVAVDGASWPLLERYGSERFFEATAPATHLFVNEREAGALTGLAGVEAARSLASRYPAVAMKLGERGALFACGEDVLRVAGEPIEERDPTGAGDAFDGAFLASLLSGADRESALRDGCLAGARAAASLDPWPAP